MSVRRPAGCLLLRLLPVLGGVWAGAPQSPITATQTFFFLFSVSFSFFLHGTLNFALPALPWSVLTYLSAQTEDTRAFQYSPPDWTGPKQGIMQLLISTWEPIYEGPPAHVGVGSHKKTFSKRVLLCQGTKKIWAWHMLHNLEELDFKKICLLLFWLTYK